MLAKRSISRYSWGGGSTCRRCRTKRRRRNLRTTEHACDKAVDAARAVIVAEKSCGAVKIVKKEMRLRFEEL